MKSRSKVFLGFLVIACAILTIAADSRTVRLVSLEWPPYIGTSLSDGSPMVKHNGFIAEIVNKAFKKAGYTVIIDFKPWNRALYEATEGLYDGLFPEYSSEERKVDFEYSSEIMGGPVGYLKRKADKIVIDSPADLKKYKIGIVSGYIHLKELESDPGIKKDEVADDETNIRMLLGNRFDLIEIDRFVAEYLIKDKFAPNADKLEFILPAREQMPLYIVFSKKAPGVKEKAAAFNAAIAEMKKSGEIDRIIKEHGFGK